MKTKSKIVKKLGALLAVVLVLVVACIPPISAVELNEQDDYSSTKFPDKITNVYSGMKVYPNMQYTNSDYGFRAYLGISSGNFYGMTSDSPNSLERYVTAHKPILTAYHTPTEDPLRQKNDVVIVWEVVWQNQPEKYHFDAGAPSSEMYEGIEGYTVTLIFYDIDIGSGVTEDSFTTFSEKVGNKTFYGVRIDTLGKNTLGYELKIQGVTSQTDDDDMLLPMPSYTSGYWTLEANTVDALLDSYYNNGYNKAMGEYEDKINQAWHDGYNSGVEGSAEFSLYPMIAGLAVAPITFVKEALNFDVFGVNVASFVQMLMTVSLVALVVVLIVRLVK